MKLKPARKIKKAIIKILTKLGKFEEFEQSIDFHLRINSKVYMPLVIEKHGDRVMVTHYYEQNGDLIADPDVEFLIQNEEWFPVGMQDCFGYARSLVIDAETKAIKYSPYKYASILSFTNLWARNLLQQGLE